MCLCECGCVPTTQAQQTHPATDKPLTTGQSMSPAGSGKEQLCEWHPAGVSAGEMDMGIPVVTRSQSVLRSVGHCLCLLLCVCAGFKLPASTHTVSQNGGWSSASARAFSLRGPKN